MDFQTARQSILNQTVNLQPDQQPFIHCLRQGQPPIPGQVTTLLLALRVVGEALRQEPTLDRTLAHAFFVLTYESRNLYQRHHQAGHEWPPLLDEDLDRIAKAVRDILADAA
ncbi:MAG: Dethiobiotin synthetase [Cyanobacteria bacterium]|nr:Dethiobiotin synthetase [Cyanobacteriota bacterium]MEB3266973.1 Dethiobiotin synthetase [Leptolyngbya sp.]